MTAIPYCDETLEVTGGCTKCSPGCKNCWAIDIVWRMAHNPTLGDKWKGLVKKTASGLNWTGKIKCFHDALDIPLRRKKPTRYFVDSKADLFHPKVPFDFRLKVWRIMSKCTQHTFLILTKRADIMKHFVGEWLSALEGDISFPVLLPNVHLGVSISTQAEADEKIPILLQIPAAVRCLSIEPMLEVIDIKKYLWVRQKRKSASRCPQCGKNHTYLVTDNIDWVVVGGESGPGARPMHPDWARSIRDQCVAAGVPFYFKQWGEFVPYEHDAQPPFLSSQHSDFIDGHILPDFESNSPQGQWIHDEYNQVYKRVGKKKAGCLLDGKSWRQLPERR